MTTRIALLIGLLVGGLLLQERPSTACQHPPDHREAEAPSYPVVDCGASGDFVTGWNACFGVNPRSSTGTVYLLNNGAVLFFIQDDFESNDSAREAYARRVGEAPAVFKRGHVRDGRGRSIGLRAVIRDNESIPPEAAGTYATFEHQIVIVRTSGNRVFRIAGSSIRAVTSFEKTFVTWNAPN